MRNQFDALAAIGSKSKIAPTSVGAKRVKHDRELLEQAALVEWANLTTMAGYRIGEYLVHVPNEGKRGPKAGGDFKKSGGKKGYVYDKKGAMNAQEGCFDDQVMSYCIAQEMRARMPARPILVHKDSAPAHWMTQ